MIAFLKENRRIDSFGHRKNAQKSETKNETVYAEVLSERRENSLVRHRRGHKKYRRCIYHA